MLADSSQVYKDRFEEVYLTYFARMKRFAQQYVMQEEDAENLVQDIFIELWEKKWEFSSFTNLNGYLFSVLKNRCIDFLRSRNVEQRVTADLQDEHLRELRLKFQSLEALDNAFLASPNIDALIEEAIATLPERCRQIFVMNKLEGKRQREIAQELELSIHTVESQMAIAYKKLKESLKNHFLLFIFFFI